MSSPSVRTAVITLTTLPQIKIKKKISYFLRLKSLTQAKEQLIICKLKFRAEVKFPTTTIFEGGR